MFKTQLLRIIQNAHRTLCDVISKSDVIAQRDIRTKSDVLAKHVNAKTSLPNDVSAKSLPNESISEQSTYLSFCGNWDQTNKEQFSKDMRVFVDFISQEEENQLMDEIGPYMKRLRYQRDHWDNAIHGYRETERLNWNEANEKVLRRIRQLAFPPGVAQIKHVHVLDLEASGVIKPHVDSVRFCGNTIAGVSLLTSAVMRLVLENQPALYVDVLVPRRSLYVMKDTARYDYTHEILGQSESRFNNEIVSRDRRISIICRNEPEAIKVE